MRLVRCLVALVVALGWMIPAGAVDLDGLWDFSRPELSEQRFRAALAHAEGDDALILQTQIARSYGLRKDFAAARAQLLAIAPAAAHAGVEVQVRYHLELGRSWVSATHPQEALTPQAREQAKKAYLQALELAKDARLEGLAVDAMHMLAMVETDPSEQLRWNRKALGLCQSSRQAAARHWEASMLNNTAYTLFQLERYEEALELFNQAVTVREKGFDASATRAAWWMVARTERALKHPDQALAIQLRLEDENDAAGDPDPDVFEELQILYREQGDLPRSDYYAARKRSVKH